MTCLLQTILLGTFVSPDVPSRKICFDDKNRNFVQPPAAKPKMDSRAAVIHSLKEYAHEWLSMSDVAALAGICKDTSGRVLKQLASEHIVSKRLVSSPKQGPKTAVYRWIKKDAKKQKAA